jgi:hypothetical protein
VFPSGFAVFEGPLITVIWDNHINLGVDLVTSRHQAVALAVTSLSEAAISNVLQSTV